MKPPTTCRWPCNHHPPTRAAPVPVPKIMFTLPLARLFLSYNTARLSLGLVIAIWFLIRPTLFQLAPSRQTTTASPRRINGPCRRLAKYLINCQWTPSGQSVSSPSVPYVLAKCRTNSNGSAKNLIRPNKWWSLWMAVPLSRLLLVHLPLEMCLDGNTCKMYNKKGGRVLNKDVPHPIPPTHITDCGIWKRNNGQ